MKISLIAAMARRRVIGKDNKIPWHVPADLRYFKERTWGRPVIMGRSTFASLKSPLANRTNIVLSRHIPPSVLREKKDSSVIWVSNKHEALKAAQNFGADPLTDEVFVIGGAQIYELFLAAVDEIILSVFDLHVEGDRFFPQLDEKQWRLTSEETRTCDGSQNDVDRFQIQRFCRKS